MNVNLLRVLNRRGRRQRAARTVPAVDFNDWFKEQCERRQTSRWVGPMHDSDALLTIPQPVRAGSWTGQSCPRCEGTPVGGWQWYTRPGTFEERLHLVLRCEHNHPWSYDTDMG